jgi:hypothetical protein
VARSQQRHSHRLSAPDRPSLATGGAFPGDSLSLSPTPTPLRKTFFSRTCISHFFQSRESHEVRPPPMSTARASCASVSRRAPTPPFHPARSSPGRGGVAETAETAQTSDRIAGRKRRRAAAPVGKAGQWSCARTMPAPRPAPYSGHWLRAFPSKSAQNSRANARLENAAVEDPHWLECATGRSSLCIAPLTSRSGGGRGRREARAPSKPLSDFLTKFSPP